MNRTAAVMTGVGVGAGLTYFLDPNSGRRRRAVARDKLLSASAQSADAIEKTAEDLSNRATGVVAETRSRFARQHVDDRKLEARVRSKMGRVVSHPRAVDVEAHDGQVTLRGPILERELDALLRTVNSVPGVRDVENALEVHETAEAVSSLQGGARRPGEVSAWMKTNWTPAVRFLAGTAGGSLLLFGLRRGDPVGAAAAMAGSGLLARAASNKELKRIVGVGDTRDAVHVQKTLTIDAPVDDIFQLWTEYESFPRFMRHLKEVRYLGDGRSHWVAKGPAGASVSWDAEVTRFERNRVLAWKSTPGSSVANAGIIHFEPAPDGGTRIHIQISYNPPAGALGHAVAWMFGRDLKSELDEDLIRLKSLVEHGKTRSGKGEVVRREEVMH